VQRHLYLLIPHQYQTRHIFAYSGFGFFWFSGCITLSVQPSCQRPAHHGSGILKRLQSRYINYLTAPLLPNNHTFPSLSSSCQRCSCHWCVPLLSSSLPQPICLAGCRTNPRLQLSHRFSRQLTLSEALNSNSSLRADGWAIHLMTFDHRGCSFDARTTEPELRPTSQNLGPLRWLKYLNSVVQPEVKTCLRESSRL